MTSEELIELSATQAVSHIAHGDIKAEVYIDVLLARENQLKGLGAFISVNQEKMREQARNVDQNRAAGRPLGPLAGLPLAIKDNIETIDLPTTGATKAMLRASSSENAPVLQRLIDAGAIVFGKANMHELAFGTTNTNFAEFCGPARNPYDQQRVPGGSSGGTAVAIGARIVPAGLGTDTGGSVRIPAAVCGVAGLRPTVGTGAQRRYDGSLVLPISHTRDTVGPMARTMEDVALLDAIICRGKIESEISLDKLRIGIPESFWLDADSEVVRVTRAACDKLADAGIEFVDVDISEIWPLNSQASFAIVLQEASTDISDYLKNHHPDVSLQDVVDGLSGPDVKEIFKAILQHDHKLAYSQAISSIRPKMQEMYAKYFAENQLVAMVFPTCMVEAPLIDLVKGSGTIAIKSGEVVGTFPTMIRNSDPGSTAGVPGITLPAGLSKTGLPIGLSLDGPMGSDTALLSIGQAMEKVLGRVPSPAL